jgi:predicted AAA+ superfamily ATPase
MDLRRDIYKELLEWRAADSGKVLEVRGARQTGKTYIIDKFARENYTTYIYINMVQTSGREFLECLEQASAWRPGEPRIDKPLHKALKLFDTSFEDERSTVVVIDEIQESAKIYSLIRQFAREFTCHFIVTGSYLGKTLSKEYFKPVGDLDILTLYTLTFEEFLDAFGKCDIYETVDLYGSSDHEVYDELKKYYEIYCQIGGYPAVVKKYVETGDAEVSVKELYKVIQIFAEESQAYFDNVLDMNLFEQLFPAIAHTMIREKKGSDDLITELSKIMYKQESNRVTKKSINNAAAWLYRSHIIDYCGKANDCNPVNVSMNSRFYFLDVGVCRYFLDMAGADIATLRGIVNENFVYLELLKRVKALEISGTAPMFGTYKEGEIDFIVNSRKNYKTYGVEVKAGKSIGRTAQQLLKDDKVEAVYFLKGDTYGGVGERTITVPIYLASRVKFDFTKK